MSKPNQSMEQSTQGVSIEPTVFTYCAEKKVRTIQNQDVTWFIAQDVCDVLTIANNRDALKALDEDEKLMSAISTSGQSRQMWTVNESGLYHLIFISRKPEAKKFRKWVTSEVLPAIRKNGSYGTSGKEQQLREVANKQNQLLTQLWNEIRDLDNIISEMRKQTTQLMVLPKLKLYTVQEHAKATHINSLDTDTAALIGQMATYYSAGKYQMGEVPHPKYGKLNKYELKPLGMAFNAVLGI